MVILLAAVWVSGIEVVVGGREVSIWVLAVAVVVEVVALLLAEKDDDDSVFSPSFVHVDVEHKSTPSVRLRLRFLGGGSSASVSRASLYLSILVRSLERIFSQVTFILANFSMDTEIHGVSSSFSATAPLVW